MRRFIRALVHFQTRFLQDYIITGGGGGAHTGETEARGAGTALPTPPDPQPDGWRDVWASVPPPPYPSALRRTPTPQRLGAVINQPHQLSSAEINDVPKEVGVRPPPAFIPINQSPETSAGAAQLPIVILTAAFLASRPRSRARHHPAALSSCFPRPLPLPSSTGPTRISGWADRGRFVTHSPM